MANVCDKNFFLLSFHQVMQMKPFRDTGDVIIPLIFSDLVYGNFVRTKEITGT